MTEFKFSPSKCVPFRDEQVLERVRKIMRQDIDKHPNPNFRIQVIKDEDLVFMWVADMYARIKTASDEGRRCVMLMPNPWPGYMNLARLINQTRLDCKHVWWFTLDEYANQEEDKDCAQTLLDPGNHRGFYRLEAQPDNH